MESLVQKLKELSPEGIAEVCHLIEFSYYEMVYANFDFLLDNYHTRGGESNQHSEKEPDFERISIYFEELDEDEQKRILN